ncbi:MAG: DNA-directed RNA polymerase subunit alpha C-terminal domain-containing protein [Planctomycetota bacterium]|nr:DNA-directed RNA polymerase subunit alpha C-terminal domain-containing protein [Planctomycetota bacterium]
MNEAGSSFADFSSTGIGTDPVADDGTLAINLLDQEVDAQVLDQFRNRLFSTVRELEKVRDWLTSPMASGLKRGLAQWALGNHSEALPTLEENRSNPTIANCLARSLLELGRVDEAEAELTNRDADPQQAATYMACKARRANIEELHATLEAMRGKLSPADVKFYEGRLHELQFEAEAAIASYDEALAIDDQHGEALFRLAVNVDLRGEDEEARELYERALMIPPVNEACVINLGILYEDMGKYLRAMQCFDLALQANPDNSRARMYRRDAAAALNMYYDEEQERREDKRNKILRTPINDFELSVRSRNCLSNMGIRSLGDLVNKSEAELLSFKNFGETSLMEIKEILRNKGLRLGMNQDEIMSKELGQTPDAPVSSEEMPDPNSPDPLRRPITELDLSVRCRRIVDLLKIKMIGDLSNRTEAELLACPNFGQTSLNEIRTKLDELGLALRT